MMEKPTFGNWITGATLIVGLIGGYVTLQTEVKNLRVELDTTTSNLQTHYVRKDIYTVNSQHIAEKLAEIQVDILAIRKDITTVLHGRAMTTR